MDVDMLLIDKQHSTLIQGNVNDNRIEGSVYSLSTCLFSGAPVLFDSVKVVWGWFNQSASTSKLVHAQKIEPLTLSELNQYVLTSASQEPNEDVPVEKPVASNGSIGADNTLAEVASGVGAEVGETTSANHSHPHLLLQD
ncbi:hypothetical protein Bca4012_042523 [Brassica carinata]|uniref:Uncharacterized protein n=1 Tax=Brassica carinata TaxID=52824 RepID=A0A8X7UH01_BRACI|nr:hypothetical protein Bca52824_059756 [Brassica carinata]